MKRTIGILALIATAGTSTLVVQAHLDDPKRLDREQRYEGPGWREVDGGAVAGGEFDAENVTLKSWITLSEIDAGASAGNDCWGYTSPNGNEYAIMGTTNGTAFIDISDPGAAEVITFIPGPNSSWRDIKTYQQFAYAVSEGGGGIQVFNLGSIDFGTVTLSAEITAGGTEASHNIAIDEESGWAYRLGGGSNGLRAYSLASPGVPAYVGLWDERYIHDAQFVTLPDDHPTHPGRQIAYCCGGFNGGWSNTGLFILDVTDKSNMVLLGEVQYSNPAYSHQGWLSDDLNYFYLNDEADETDFGLPTTTHIIDVSDLTNPVDVGTFTSGAAAIDHNLYVKGDLIYEANYRSGIRVFDKSNPLAPVEVAYFDTYPGSDSANFSGLWSIYPFFDSQIVIGSDIQRGLFVWEIGGPDASFSFPDGIPTTLSPEGQSLAVEIVPGEETIFVPGTAKLRFDDGSGEQTTNLSQVGSTSFIANFPTLDCPSSVNWYLTISGTVGGSSTEFRSPSAGFYTSTVGTLEVTFSDDIEADAGWTVGVPSDTAVTGIWERVDPVGTSSQPENDHSPEGTICWITGQQIPGDGDGANDIDGGVTTLISPQIDVSGLVDPVVSFYTWYSNNEGKSNSLTAQLLDHIKCKNILL